MDVANNLSFKLINTSSANGDYTSSVLSSLPVNVFYIGKDLRFQYLNTACENYLDKKKDDVIGKAIHEVLGKKVLDEMISKQNGSAINFKSEILRGASEQSAEFIFTPDLDAEKEVC